MKFMAILTALAALFAFSASADGLKFSEGRELRISNTILCDTQEQLESIFIAQMDGFEFGVQQYRELVNTRNTHAAPVCLFFGSRAPLPVRLIRTVSEFQDVPFRSGTQTVYVHEVRWPFGNGEWVQGFIFSDSRILPAGEPA